MGDESEFLNELGDIEQAVEDAYWLHIQKTLIEIGRIINQNENVKIGDTVKCPVCQEYFVKKTKNQKFCGRKIKGRSSCKNKYHNYGTWINKLENE